MRRAVPALVVALSFVVASAWPIAPPSAADEIADKRAEAARISRQLDEQGERISVLAEEYNNARLQADRLTEKLDATKAELAATDERAGLLKRRLKAQAVESYVQGGTVPALSLLVDSGLEDDLAVRRHYAETVTSQVGDTIDELREVRLTLEEQTGDLARAERASREALAAVSGRRAAALAAQRSQERLLGEVKGDLAELVAAEAKRKADEEARRAEAELAVRRAAARDAAARDARRTTATTAPARQATVPKTAEAPDDAPPPSSAAAAAVEEAKRQLGKPYEWGGSGPDSFDCSGLTSWAWRAAGRSLPHSSEAQYSATSRVAIGNLAPGDLVFFGDPIHHVGIYVGSGQMIEAPTTGSNVRYASIYRSDYVGAGRVN